MTLSPATLLLRESVGEWIGLLLFFGLGLLMLVSGVRGRRQETLSRRANAGFLAASLLWLTASLVSLSNRWDPDMLWPQALGGLAFIVLLPATGLLSLLGLIDVMRRRKKSVRGYVRSTTGLLVCAVFLLPAYLVMVSRVGERRSPSEKPGISRDFEELNFRFESPAGWVPADLTAIRKQAPETQLYLARAMPQAYFMLIATDVGQEQELDVLAAAVEVDLRTRAELRSVKNETVEIAGVEGRQIVVDVKLKAIPIWQSHVVLSHSGTVYQLITWVDQRKVERRKLRELARDLSAGFSLLDKDRPLHSGKTLARFQSSEFPYEIGTGSEEWLVWDDLAQDYPECDFGAQLDLLSYVTVHAVHLQGLDPSLPMLADAFRDFSGLDPSSHAIGPPSQDTWQGRPVQTITFRRTLEGSDYLLKEVVIRDGPVGYLLTVWTLEDGERQSIDRLFDRVANAWRMKTPSANDTFDIDRLPARLRTAHRDFFVALAMEYSDQNQSALAARASLAGLRFAPGDPDVLLEVVSHHYDSGANEEALELLEANADLVEGNAEVHSWRAFILKELGRNEAARADYRSLFARGYREAEDVGLYVDLLWDLQEPEEARTLLRELRSQGDSLELVEIEAKLLRREEKLDSAIDLLRDGLARFDYDPSVGDRLLSIYHQAERHADAVEYCGELQKKHPQDSRLLYHRGRNEYALGWYRPALQSFRRALKIRPADKKSQEYADYIEGILGQGSHGSIRTPIEAVPLAEAQQELLADEEGVLPGDAGAAFEHRVRSYLFLEKQDFKTTDRWRVRVHDDRGVNDFSTLYFTFDPLDERIWVNSLLVRNADGEQIYEGSLDDYYVLDASDGSQADQDKRLHVPVAGLAAGCTLDLVITRQSLSPRERIPFDRYSLSLRHPVRHSLVTIAGDVDSLASVETEVERRKTAEGTLWYVSQPRVYHAESYAMPVSRYLPHLWIGDSRGDWKEIGLEYLKDIEKKLVVDDGVRVAARVLTEKLEDDDEKVRVLARYVQKNCVYKAIEFGERARIPNSAGQVLENRYGDCKDQAVLLRGLLSAIGIEAHLALASVSYSLRPEIPSLSQFDHMIVFVPGYRGGTFFDTTDGDLAPGETSPFALGGSQALVLDAPQPRLQRIPEYGERSNRIRSHLAYSIGSEEDLQVVHELRLFGYVAAFMRSFLLGYGEGERSAELLRSVSSYGPVKSLELVETENLENNVDPLRVVMRYTLRDRVHRLDDRMLVHLSAPWERSYLEVAADPNRKSPFRIDYPLHLETVQELTPPSELERWEPVPPPTAREGEFISFRAKSRNENGVFHLEATTVRHSAGSLEPSRFADFVESADHALRSLEPRVVLLKGD